MNRRRAVVAVVSVLGVAVIALGGTGLVVASRNGTGDIGSTSGGAGSSSTGGVDQGAPEPAGVASPAPGADGAAGSTGAASNGSAGNGAAAGVVATTRQVVRTATITVTASDPDAAGDRATAIADAAGGRVDSDVRGDGQGHGATLTLRVPADRLDATLAQLAALGEETAREVQGDDVTAQTADLGARVEALQTSVDRLRTLISDSGSLADLLAVETQLTARQADLESLQAQQRALADQVSLASVTVTLVPPAVVAAARATGPTGFGGALAGGWHGFTVAVRYVLAGLGYTLPFLVVAALAVAGVLVVRRRRADRHRGNGPTDVAVG